jgi:putative transcriptional regulator
MAVNISYANQFLVATPNITQGSLFQHAVVYVCQHGPEGAYGFIVNHPIFLTVEAMLKEMAIPAHKHFPEHERMVLCGGPMQVGRGFVLHRNQENFRLSQLLNSELILTTSEDVLQAIAAGQGPKDCLIALGHTAWPAGLLDQEIIDNVWLPCPFSAKIMYDTPYEKRWEAAGELMGINILEMINKPGHA